MKHFKKDLDLLL